MATMNEEEVALYAILNGQKEALKHLQVREGDMQTYLSKFLARNEPVQFFKKIRQLLFQIQQYMDPDEISQHYQISQPILKLIINTTEAEDQSENFNILDIVSHKKRKEGEMENNEFLLNFKRYRNDGNASQYEEEDYTLQGQHHQPFTTEDQVEGNEKKRNKRTKLNVDQKMLEHLKLVQEDVLKVKDVADKYKVSPACIYQIMRTHGFIAPNKGRGRKSTSEIEHQYMQAMNQGGQQALPKPTMNESDLYDPSKMQQNQNYSHMQGQQSYNPNQLMHPGSMNSQNLTSQLIHSQVQQNLGNSLQMSSINQSILNQGAMQSPSVASMPALGSYMQTGNMGAQMMSSLQSQQLMSQMDSLHYGNDHCLSSQQGMGMMNFGSQQDNMGMQQLNSRRRHKQRQFDRMGSNEESKQQQEEEEEEQEKSENSEDNNEQEEDNESENNENEKEEGDNDGSESDRTEAMDD